MAQHAVTPRPNESEHSNALVRRSDARQCLDRASRARAAAAAALRRYAERHESPERRAAAASSGATGTGGSLTDVTSAITSYAASLRRLGMPPERSLVLVKALVRRAAPRTADGMPYDAPLQALAFRAWLAGYYAA